MTDVISNPSLRLRVFATLARWALWLLASAWITVGLVWGGLHFLIVPRIGEFRPWVEQQATRTLGITVRIGDMTAESNGRGTPGEIQNAILDDIVSALKRLVPEARC